MNELDNHLYGQVNSAIDFLKEEFHAAPTKCLNPSTIKVKDRCDFETGELRADYMQVSCGKCIICQLRKSKEWGNRMLEEQKRSLTSLFVTWTYADDYLPKTELVDVNPDDEDAPKMQFPTFNRTHVKLLHKQLKQLQDRYCKQFDIMWPQIKYFTSSEYGEEGGRSHYHSVLFNVHPIIEEKIRNGDVWQYGFVKVKKADKAKIHYVAKYLLEEQAEQIHPAQEQPFQIMSKGIGAGYLTDAKVKWHRPSDNPEEWRNYLPKGQFKASLPRYYTDRIFDRPDRRHFEQKQSLSKADRWDEELRKVLTDYPYITTGAQLLETYKVHRKRNAELIKQRAISKRTKSLRQL